MDDCPVFLKKFKSSGEGQRGVTIVEIMIVVAFLAVLGVILLVALKPQTQLAKSRDARRKADLNKLKNIFEDYYNDKKQYPPTLPACGQPLSGYLDKIPCDPRDSSPYGYTAGAQSFRLYAKLEYDKDLSIAQVGCQNNCGPGCAYNWGVSSSNVGLEVCAGGGGGCPSGPWWGCQGPAGCPGGTCSCNNIPAPTCSAGGTIYCDSICGGGCEGQTPCIP